MYWHVTPSLQSALLHIPLTLPQTPELNKYSQNIPGVVQLHSTLHPLISLLTICIGKINKIFYISSHGTNGKIKSIKSFLISNPFKSSKSTVTLYVTVTFLIAGFWEGIEIYSLILNQQIEYNRISSFNPFAIVCKNCNAEIGLFQEPIATQLPLNNSLNDIFCNECEHDIPRLVERNPRLNEIFLDTNHYIINLQNLNTHNLLNSNCSNCSTLFHKYKSFADNPEFVTDDNKVLSPRNLKVDKIKLYKGDFGYINDNHAYYKYLQEFINPLMPLKHLLKLFITYTDLSNPEWLISLIITNRDTYILPVYNPEDNSCDLTENISEYHNYSTDFENKSLASAKKLFDTTPPVIGKRVLWKLGNNLTNLPPVITLSHTSYNFLLNHLTKFTISDPSNQHSDLKTSTIPI